MRGYYIVNNPADLVERYIALWHQTDAAERRAAIEALWTPDGAHYSPTLEARGYDELAARVLRSHRRWVIDQHYIFRSTRDLQAHHDAVTFTWEMLPRDGGAIESVGQDFFLLAPDGRARAV
jgi:SnoaL-like domain